MFTVVRFCLATTCYMFTKVLRPLVKFWCSRYVKIVVYLEDGIGCAKGVDGARAASDLVNSTRRNVIGIHPK